MNTRVGQSGARGDGHFGVQLLAVRDRGAARYRLREAQIVVERDNQLERDAAAHLLERLLTERYWRVGGRGVARERALNRDRVLHDERRRIRRVHHQHHRVCVDERRVRDLRVQV